MMRVCLVLMALMMGVGGAVASSNYYFHQPVGWHWDNVHQKAVVMKRKPSAPTINQMNPMQQVKAVHHALMMAKDEAVMSPTPQNIARYMAIQKWVENQSTRFTVNWMKTLLQYPQYNYELHHPTASFINQVHNIHIDRAKAHLAKKLAKQDMLVFFYRGMNPLDQQYSKSVVPFAKQYGFKLMGASMDGYRIGSIKMNIDGRGYYRAFGLKALPALVLLNPQTGKHTLISYGYYAEDDILNSLYKVETNYKGNLS